MTENASLSFLPYLRARFLHDFGASKAWFGQKWRDRYLFKFAVLGAGAAVMIWSAGWLMLASNLPDAEKLIDYEVPLPTVVRDVDGEIAHSYARDRRVQLEYADFPPLLIDAFLAAEDRTFFSHSGVDLTGTLNAVFDYIRKFGSDQRAVGGSTITQQVAKNLLLGDEYSVTRKLKEMILAGRIEEVLSKQEILELYLNAIPLGRRSFGVQAASRAYFDKDVGDLQLHEMAFLAILPKAPERYGRDAYAEQALARRNFVLDQMVRNGFADANAVADAKKKPLGLVKRQERRQSEFARYFTEEVRRQLIKRFGENEEDGPNSVYAGGLWVRTSLDPQLQKAARDALREGLMRFWRGRGWSGPIAKIDLAEGSWARQLASSYLAINYRDWRIGVVTRLDGNTGSIGFPDGQEAPLSGVPKALKAGDVIAVKPQGRGWTLANVPGVSGGFLAESVRTGRIFAMQGGFDQRLSDFNRATQAMRQPGSTIKPFVYAAGLDAGLTPASEIPDETFCYYQGAKLGEKCFRNFGGAGGGGIHTMRWGLEQSRNLMTVHVAMQAGMERVVDTIERMGIGSYQPYPAFALGAGDTSVLKIVNAYAALANQGRLHSPSVIDFVQDRRGKVIWRADNRRCQGCNMPEWDGKPMPRFALKGKQAIDPRTAYQVIHMLEGVVIRGTAARLRGLGLPLFGKTGTTSGPTNAWFVGGTSDIVAGVYVGYDTPRNLGGWVQGGNTAAPIFKDFVEATKNFWREEPPVAPTGIRMVRIDRLSGKRVFSGTPSNDPKADVIWEAFKPDSEPPRATRRDLIDAKRNEILAMIRMARENAANQKDNGDSLRQGDFVKEQGGIY